MILYEFQIWGGPVGVIIIAIAAAVAVFRLRHPSTVLQAIGAVSLLLVVVMSHIPLTHATKYREGLYRIEPEWVVQTEAGLSGIGMIVFSVGYCWYWLSVNRRKPAE